MDNKPKRSYHIKPTSKQIKTLQLMSQGFSKRKAMLQAGYSKSTANTATKLVVQSRGAQQLLDNLITKLDDVGINTDYMAQKFKEFMEANKDDKADYRTRLEAFKSYRELVKPKEESSPGVKRKITFEEFIGENKNENQL